MHFLLNVTGRRLGFLSVFNIPVKGFVAYYSYLFSIQYIFMSALCVYFLSVFLGKHQQCAQNP